MTLAQIQYLRHADTSIALKRQDHHSSPLHKLLYMFFYVRHQAPFAKFLCLHSISSPLWGGHWIMLKIIWSWAHIIRIACKEATYPLWICLSWKLSPATECLDRLAIHEMWTNQSPMPPWCNEPNLWPIRTDQMCNKSSNKWILV